MQQLQLTARWKETHVLIQYVFQNYNKTTIIAPWTNILEFNKGKLEKYNVLGICEATRLRDEESQ